MIAKMDLNAMDLNEVHTYLQSGALLWQLFWVMQSQGDVFCLAQHDFCLKYVILPLTLSVVTITWLHFCVLLVEIWLLLM